MQRYIFSGHLTDKMAEGLKSQKDFEPIDVLVSQLDRSSVKKMLELIDFGVVNSLFIDSGAFSQYTGKCGEIDVDEYIRYVDGLDDHIYAVAQVDSLPGKFGKPKHPDDYRKSSDASWENYLYMRKKMKSPEKLIHVFHYGEPFSALERALEFRDTSITNTDTWESLVIGTVYPDRLNILGLSPANDTSQPVKDLWLSQCYDLIQKSSYPDVRTHLFGMTSLQALAKFPCYSADSVSHRLRSAYGKIYTRKWGVISLSDRTRDSKTKSNYNFFRVCDDKTRKEFEGFLQQYGYSVEDVMGDNAYRTVVDICETQKAWKYDFQYHPNNRLTRKKLFDL